MSNMPSLINIDGLSNVAVKLLDMIEKSVGWVITPKGTQRDFIEGLEIYKKGIEADDNLSPIEKGAQISTVRKNLREYINQGCIVASAIPHLDHSSNPDKIDPDWLSHFFDYAKNISNKDMQLIWGKLLACKANGKNDISKKLIQVFSYIENEDIDIFCKMCAMTFESKDRERSKYPFIYITKHPSYYNKHGIRRYHLASLDNLGLIEYDIQNGFVLPKDVPLLQYGSVLVRLDSTDRINNGNVRFTKAGSVLFEITQISTMDDFLDNCSLVWSRENIKCKYE